jgi:hypothetical protein
MKDVEHFIYEYKSDCHTELSTDATKNKFEISLDSGDGRTYLKYFFDIISAKRLRDLLDNFLEENK